MKDSWLKLRWKLPFFEGQGYINRVIPVSGWFVLTFTCWTWSRMTRRGSRRRTAAPIEDAGGILRKVIMWPSGYALSFYNWNCKEQFWSLLRRQQWVRKEARGFYRPVVSWRQTWHREPNNEHIFAHQGLLRFLLFALFNYSSLCFSFYHTLFCRVK